MASSDESVADSDDDMISCHICLLRFNTMDRKPKYLDCHHYFCFNCIRGFSKTNIVSCPTCRNKTNMTGRQIEELATNNIVLRLVTIATDRARELAEREKKQQIHLITPKQVAASSSKPKKLLWCSQCSVLSTATCQRQQHIMCDYTEVLKENMTMLQGRVNECCTMWDKAIEDRQRVHQFYDDILKSLRMLQNDVINRVELNDSQIALMESRKQVALDLIPSNRSQDLSEEDAVRVMSKNTIEQIDNWCADGKHSLYHSQQLLQNLVSIEENCIDVSFANIRPEGKLLRSVDLLKKLQLSFNGTHHSTPAVKACVSALSFVILKVAEGQSKQIIGNSSPNPSGHQIKFELQKDHASGPVKQPLIQVDNQSSDGDDESNDHNYAAARVKQSSNKSFRDLLLQPAVKPTNEWQTVSKSSARDPKTLVGGSVKNKCYFRITIDGVTAENIVFLLEPKICPVMSAKFVEMCTAKVSYQGSRIFKAVKNESVMVSSRWFHTLEERQDLFTADRSDIKEKRGSVRFQVKQTNSGLVDVSTEFQVILANRPRHHKCTTVFAQVIEGLNVFEKIGEMNLKEHKIFVAECGLC